MQESLISKLNKMLGNLDMAFDVVTTSCAEEGNTAAIMLGANFKPLDEPHLRGMLTSIRAALFGDIREKATIYVSSGRWLMGCLDELTILEKGSALFKCQIIHLKTALRSLVQSFGDKKRFTSY
ncbi:hypothetical protein AgCh_007862 [Apium graveolens]